MACGTTIWPRSGAAEELCLGALACSAAEVRRRWSGVEEGDGTRVGRRWSQVPGSPPLLAAVIGPRRSPAERRVGGPMGSVAVRWPETRTGRAATRGRSGSGPAPPGHGDLPARGAHDDCLLCSFVAFLIHWPGGGRFCPRQAPTPRVNESACRAPIQAMAEPGRGRGARPLPPPRPGLSLALTRRWPVGLLVTLICGGVRRVRGLAAGCTPPWPVVRFRGPVSGPTGGRRRPRGVEEPSRVRAVHAGSEA